MEVSRKAKHKKFHLLGWNFLAGRMGFEPTVTAVTGQRIKPGYATDPRFILFIASLKYTNFRFK